MPTAPQSRRGRYADLDSGQLAERAYDRGETLDWELAFELCRRAMSAEGADDAGGAVRAARPA